MKMHKSYQIFDIDPFKRDFWEESLENHITYDYSCFQNIALFNRHPPIKKMIMCFNNNPFLSKALKKAIIYRSKLKKTYSKYRTEDN